jgi:hypothetical protein
MDAIKAINGLIDAMIMPDEGWLPEQIKAFAEAQTYIDQICRLCPHAHGDAVGVPGVRFCAHCKRYFEVYPAPLYNFLEGESLNEHERADLYRTSWLMAQNRIHDLVHRDRLLSPEWFEEYLAEQRTAPEIAKRPA